jgi:DNA modification methylase
VSKGSRSVELVWSGKHGRDASEREPSPLKRVAHFARAPRTEVAPNELVLGDNLAALRFWLERWAGQVDLAYLDPPFATRGDFSITTDLGGRRVRRTAYRDGWGRDLGGYLSMLLTRLELVRELLSERGSLFLHVDYRVSALVRCLLDEVFGARACVNEIIWLYKTGGAARRPGFARKHDTIWYYAKNPRRALWTPQQEKSYLRHAYGFGNIQVHRDEHGPFTWVGCRDVFDIPALRGNQPERVNYPTQKPEALLERILRAASVEGSLVMDPFCGSGTTLVVAERLGRRWLGCDESRLAVHTTRQRLLACPALESFEVVEGAPPGSVEADGPLANARLVVEIERSGPRMVQVRLAGLERGSRRESRSWPEPWHTAIDSWAIDHEFDGAVFSPDWWARRTRPQGDLVLSAPSHRYRRPGRRQILVKAYDPFGFELAHLLDLAP